MKIVIGCDHAAFLMKEFVNEFLHQKKIEILDVGTKSADRCDYPDFAKALVKEVLEKNLTGILLCGSGIGMSIVANRYKGIRAALCRTPEEAQLARQHNNANVLCLGSRIHTNEEIALIIEAWLGSKFEEGRHLDRLLKFQDLGETL